MSGNPPLFLVDAPGLGELARARVDLHLKGGCFCGGGEAALRRRTTVRGVLTIQMQCLNCGVAIGGALKRDDHPAHDSYSEWDSDLQEAFHQASIDALAARRAVFTPPKVNADPFDAMLYPEFLRTPEWRRLRDLVVARAGNVCEACLSAPIRDVHHLENYKLGRLPPAWLLRGVCRQCHDRMHDAADRWAKT